MVLTRHRCDCNRYGSNAQETFENEETRRRFDFCSASLTAGLLWILSLNLRLHLVRCSCLRPWWRSGCPRLFDTICGHHVSLRKISLAITVCEMSGGGEHLQASVRLEPK